MLCLCCSTGREFSNELSYKFSYPCHVSNDGNAGSDSSRRGEPVGRITDRRAGRIPTEQSAPLAVKLREVILPGERFRGVMKK